MKIVTKQKGDKKYFYLKHSFRKNGEVVFKEKYLGTEIPKDIDQIVLSFKKEVQMELNKKLELIKKNGRVCNFFQKWKME